MTEPKILQITVNKTVRQVNIRGIIDGSSRIVRQANIEVNPASPKQVAISATRTSRLVSMEAHHPVRQVNIDVNKVSGPPGKSFDFTNFITEQLNGAVDGENRIFTSSVQFESATLTVYINGLKQHDFITPSDNQIIVDSPPQNTGFTDIIEATYIKKQY
jgi:hypothetical protein